MDSSCKCWRSKFHFQALNQLSNEQNTEIILSGTTSTGLSPAEEKFGHLVSGIGPFPLDWFPFEQGLEKNQSGCDCNGG